MNSIAILGVVAAFGVAAIVAYIKGGYVTKIGIIWIIAALIVDIWVIFQKCVPNISDTNYNLWWDKNYNVSLNALWYISGIGAYLQKVLFYYGASKLASLHSFKLYKVTLVFVIYYITQFAFWLWNKNTSVWANFLVYLCVAIVVTYLIAPDKQTAKCRRIDS